jgi:putative transposase
LEDKKMPNTYSQLYIHIIFTVKGKSNLLKKENKEELHKYITGIITHRKQKLICINSVKDHIHLLISIAPDITVSEIVRDIKHYSTDLINKNNWVVGKFHWQEGFGAFSCSKSHQDNVVKYIQKQEEHHKKHTFREEYISFLKKYEIEYNEKYLFDWIE